LQLRNDADYERQERVSYADTSAALTHLKKEEATAWWNEVSSVPLQQVLRPFFEGRAKDRTCKKKHGTQAAEYTTSAFTWDAEQGAVKLAKMRESLVMVRPRRRCH
jgi:putative transposase